MINLVWFVFDPGCITHVFVVALTLAVTSFVFWFGIKTPEEPPFKQFSHLSTSKSNTKSKKKEKKLHLNGDITNSDSAKGKSKIVKHPNKLSQTESKAIKPASIPDKLTDTSKQVSSGTKKEKKDKFIDESLKTTKTHDNNEDDGWESVSRKDKKSRKTGNEEPGKTGAAKNKKNKNEKVNNNKNADKTKSVTENEKIKSAKRTNTIKKETLKKSNDGSSPKPTEKKGIKVVKKEAEKTNDGNDENNNKKKAKNSKSNESAVVAKKVSEKPVVANSPVKASNEKLKLENNSLVKAPAVKEKTENSSSGKQSDAKKKSDKNVDKANKKENVTNKENIDKNKSTVKSADGETIAKMKIGDKNVQKLKESNDKQQRKPPANKKDNIVDTPVVKKETPVQEPKVNAKKKKLVKEP